MPEPRGYVIWEGPSRLDGIQPIVAIVTMHSVNEKTGDMPQVWFLAQSAPPTTAAARGLDVGVCGDGALDPGEECDDGNTTSGDGCDASCQLEAGDGVPPYFKVAFFGCRRCQNLQYHWYQ